MKGMRRGEMRDVVRLLCGSDVPRGISRPSCFLVYLLVSDKLIRRAGVHTSLLAWPSLLVTDGRHLHRIEGVMLATTVPVLC